MIRAVIFDLDGVIVSTDEYHFRAWKRVADEEGIPFTRQNNERLRGVSRMESLEIVLERAARTYTDSEKQVLAGRKNGYYRDFLRTLTPADILPGVLSLVDELRERGIRLAVGSSSKNAGPILKAIGMEEAFDVVVDGTHISRSKPDPEVFAKAGERLGIPPAQCLVVEDAEAGVEAGLAAGMPVLAVGSAATHTGATLAATSLEKITVEEMLQAKFPRDRTGVIVWPPAGEPEETYSTLCCTGKGRAEVPAAPDRPQKERLTFRVAAPYAGEIGKSASPLDALGPTDWYQAMWPSDASMPEPKFPRFHVLPRDPGDAGFSLTRRRHRDPLMATLRLRIGTADGLLPVYGGGADAQIAHRTGNLLRLVDTSAPVPHSLEMLVKYHWLVIFRIRLGAPCELIVDHEPLDDGERRYYGVRFLPGANPGEVFIAAAFDLPTPQELEGVLVQSTWDVADFDADWQRLVQGQDPAPFLTGRESGQERNLVAAFVNRIFRKVRVGGKIQQPSMLEFFGPEWDFGDGVWVFFQPTCRSILWIEPRLWANSIRTLLSYQRPDGMVPQAVFPKFTYTYSQIPNITPCVRDYYAFTGDRAFLEYAYPRFKAWYRWWLTQRNPTGDGIMAVGSSGQDLYTSICEYKDNGTDPGNPEVFENTCNPLTRTGAISGRPERAYLPDIVACQARMAEDLAFMAGELGLREDADAFTAEYHRIRDWANRYLWDEATRFYYTVERATGRKVMKRSNVAFWMLWAGIADARQKDALVEAMFDSRQFFTPIPLPLIAVNDPSFNPRCGHWGDGYVWAIDVFTAFDGLLRYGEWDLAARLAKRFNDGVFAAIRDTFQPAEYYHHSGMPCGCPIMGTAGLTPLTFKRYLRDYRAGAAARDWERFAPRPMTH